MNPLSEDDFDCRAETQDLVHLSAHSNILEAKLAHVFRLVDVP